MRIFVDFNPDQLFIHDLVRHINVSRHGHIINGLDSLASNAVGGPPYYEISCPSSPQKKDPNEDVVCCGS
jgi:hypothetical protein